MNADTSNALSNWVVTVEFMIRRECVGAFLERLNRQAAESLREPGCSRFDVCVDSSNKHRIFLYEVYSDREAFDAHLASAHFKDFDTVTRPCVDSKTVAQWRLTRGPSARTRLGEATYGVLD
jgi:(4S)-4-hydroxy-5-phosphonooxypentane-2,3-dione isomerase